MKIGRYILVLCLLSFSVAVFCPLQAQPRLRMPKYWVGVHGGVSASTVAFSPRVEGTSNIVKASVLGGNGGFVFRSGCTGVNKENKHIIEYRLTLDSNPEFTTSVLIAYARAAKRMYDEGIRGAKTVLDVPPAYLSTMSGEELRAHCL